MSHSCKALIIHCIDFRLGQSIYEFLKKQKLLGDCDIVGIAGSAKNFSDKDSRDTLMRQIEISVKLHSISKVILMNHTDCGAYGGRSAFDSVEDEEQTHKSALELGEKEIKEKFHELEIQKLIARISEDGKIEICDV